MTMESTDSQWQKETVTLLPSIESVSSTAMVMQVKNYVFFVINKYQFKKAAAQANDFLKIILSISTPGALR